MRKHGTQNRVPQCSPGCGKRSQKRNSRKSSRRYRQTGRQLQVNQTLKEVTASQQVLASLLKEKEAQQISLSELEARTGIGRSNLSRLWNNPSPNVTLETVERIASALNCRLEITVQLQK